MGLWNKYKEYRAEQLTVADAVNQLLSAVVDTEIIGKAEALSIPCVSACTDLIANTISGLNIKLYKEEEGKTEEIKNDNRTFLLNKNTGDTLNPNEFKKAMIVDYLLDGNSYSYINKKGTKVQSLNYVKTENVSKFNDIDPIFKSNSLSVNGNSYQDFQFIKLLKNTRDGISGNSIVIQNNKALKIAYQTILFEEKLLATGGSKKGFIKAQKKLTDEQITALKTAWKNLYTTNTENVVVLSEGMDFAESQATSQEMQMNENKISNNGEICKMFLTPTGLLEGNITEQEYNNWIKTCIIPIILAFESAINSVLLTEKEKLKGYYFSFDTNNLLKGNLEQRLLAYGTAIKNGIYTPNEVRNIENLPEIDGMNVITTSLGTVLYDIEKKTWFVPNTSITTNLKTSTTNNTTNTDLKDNLEGGEKDEIGNKK